MQKNIISVRITKGMILIMKTKQKSTNDRGITLISLIITVLILIILAAVSDLILPDDLFKKADNAEKYTAGVLEDSQNNINNIKNSIPDIIDIDFSNNIPTLEVSVKDVTETSATIVAKGTDYDNDELQYTLTIDGKIYGPGTTCEWNITDLQENTEYTYVVTVTDGKDNTTATGSFTTIKGNRAPSLEVNVLDITTTTATINAIGTDSDGDTLNYTLKLNGQTISEATTQNEWDLTGLSPHTTYQYEVNLSDRKVTTTKSGNFTTGNTAPTISSVNATNITPTTATITATGNDGDGDLLTYTLEINGKSYTSNTGIFDVTGLTEITTYSYTVKVSDGFDEVQKESSLTTLKANTAPVIKNNYNYSSTSQTTSFTIRMRATDVDGDALTYTLYYSTSENGTYTSSGTASASAGSYTTITQSSLSTYTPYWWYITVTDGKETVTSGKQTLNTYCSGTGSTCSMKECTSNKSTCTVCGGDGWVTCSSTKYAFKESGTDSYLHDDGDSNPNYCDGRDDVDYKEYVCSVCGGTRQVWKCSTCGWSYNTEYVSGSYFVDSHSTYCTSSTCYSGYVYSTCSTHSRSDHHYYCTKHSIVSTSSSHKYCSHGNTSAHNN